MHLHTNRHRLPRRIFFWVGSVLSLAGAVVLGMIPFFYWRSATIGEQLLQQASTLVSNTAGPSPATSSPTTSNTKPTDAGKLPIHNTPSIQMMSEGLTIPAFRTGQIIGEVLIPTLSLKAPLIQGTSASQLEAAVGHLVTSVMPGKPGTALIAAHNATWFRHINRLKPGDLIQVKTLYGTLSFHVTSSKVVKTGDVVSNTLNSSIVLESCYPLNALYLTPYRYLVYGKLDHISSTQIAAADTHSGTDYYVTIPQRIVNEGLTLKTNTLPMGTLTFTGKPSDSFTQSNDAWSATHTMIESYLAWIHASADKDQTAITAIAPKTLVNPFFGVNLREVTYLSHFNVSLDVQGGQLVSATGTTQVRINGTSYTIVLVGHAHGHQVKLTQIVVK